jgi:hypothetical protein
MEHFELLAACIRSDQLSAQQVHREMQDPSFRRWYTQTYLTPTQATMPGTPLPNDPDA